MRPSIDLVPQVAAFRRRLPAAHCGMSFVKGKPHSAPEPFVSVVRIAVFVRVKVAPTGKGIWTKTEEDTRSENSSDLIGWTKKMDWIGGGD